MSDFKAKLHQSDSQTSWLDLKNPMSKRMGYRKGGEWKKGTGRMKGDPRVYL